MQLCVCERKSDFFQVLRSFPLGRFLPEDWFFSIFNAFHSDHDVQRFQMPEIHALIFHNPNSELVRSPVIYFVLLGPVWADS